MSKRFLLLSVMFLIAISAFVVYNNLVKRDVVIEYISSPVGDVEDDNPFLIKSSNDLPLTVQFGTGMCFGDCPVYRIVILYDGTAYFDGELNTLDDDIHKVKLSTDEIDQLKDKILEVKFFDMNIQSSYITDVSYNHLAIGWGEKSKSMTYIGGQELPKELYDLQCFIHTIVKSETWVGVRDWTCARLNKESANYGFSN